MPTPRGGGVAIVVTFFLALLTMHLAGGPAGRVVAALTYGGGAIAIVGFIDDRKSLPASVRMIVHVGAALLAIALIGLPIGLLGSECGYYVWPLRLASFLAIIWAINLFNFMDGIDGIAALEATFFAGAAAGFNAYFHGNPGLTTMMLSLAFATLGFLVWNWPPARIFMGDVGSGFLGFTLATFVLRMSHDHLVAVAICLILGGVFFVDASVTLIRRIARGDRWSDAHRMHAYQHLARRWRAHRPVTMLVGAVNVGWLLPLACAAAVRPAYAVLFVMMALLPLVLLTVIVGAGAP